jgi:hypothetical protein
MVIIHVDVLAGLAVYLELVLVEGTLSSQLDHGGLHPATEGLEEPTVDFGQSLGGPQLLVGYLVQVAESVSLLQPPLHLSISSQRQQFHLGIPEGSNRV